MTHILDKPVWNALTTNNGVLSHGTATAKHFDIGVSPFAATIDPHPDHFNALYDLISHNEPIIIPAKEENLKVGRWAQLARVDGYQMLYKSTTRKQISYESVLPLESNHVDEMLKLTQQTEPGPFSRETIKFGHYYGIIEEGKLLAMAGQRLHPQNYVEISAVCTDPEFTGKGFARKLVSHQIDRILGNNETPFLHVKIENVHAIRLYQSMGFEIRTKICFHVLKK